MTSLRRFADLRAPEVSARLSPSSVLVQPIAAVEQHGPHLPLSTDVIVATSSVDAVVAERGEELDLWVLPPLAYGKSNEHAWAPGTVWLSATTLLAVLADLGRSLASLPTRRLAFVNGREVRLTPTQYKLYATLMRNAGKVLTHEQILFTVWGPAYTRETQYLRVYMGHLRHKFEPDPARPRYFLTEPGVGYRLRGE